jgi:hypothetical protein
LLNKLPGKEGKRWIVLPFSLEGGLDVCLRILLAPTDAPAGAYSAEQMTMDIQSKESRWVFTLRTAPRGPYSLELTRCPAATEALEQRAAKLLGAVRVQKNNEFSLFAEDNRDWTLRSVNKEV